MKKKFMLLTLPLVAIVMTSSILSDNGKAGKTGSPGELTCRDCHGDFAANTGGGSITISNTGMTNWQYVPGQTYPITVTVARTGSTVFGLGVECLTAANTNAGTLVITNSAQTQIKSVTVSGVVRNNVVHQLNAGHTPNTKSFTFNWTAPAAGTGTVKFYFAGIAGDFSGDEGGDYVYNSSQTVTEFCAAPATPGTITGTANNNCGVSTKTYTIAAVAGATSYVWRTDIVGAVLNGTNDTVTTTTPSVSLTFPSNFVNAKLYVKAVNACGSSAEKLKSLSSKPAVPAAITGASSLCTGGANSTYTIAAVANATSYSWTVPTTYLSAVSGQGTTTMIVKPKTVAGLCTLKVGSVNACGTSTKKSLPITLAACPRTYEMVQNGLYFSELPEMIEVYSVDGRFVQSYQRPSENNFQPELPYGLYIFRMRFEDHVESQKVMIQ